MLGFDTTLNPMERMFLALYLCILEPSEKPRQLLGPSFILSANIYWSLVANQDLSWILVCQVSLRRHLFTGGRGHETLRGPRQHLTCIRHLGKKDGASPHVRARPANTCGVVSPWTIAL